MADRYELRLPCIRVKQGDRFLYSFAVDGKVLGDFAAVARVGRDDDSLLQGYQRPEVQRHIRGIQRYLETSNALLPNAIVVAFGESVYFEALSGAACSDVSYSTLGMLVIPVDEAAGENDKPGWIVDGQQRTAAIREARVDEFPVCVVSFVAAESEQRAQFILVNNTKPLPKGLIHELLPATQEELPLPLMRRRLAAEILYRLNTDHDSPFRHLIATPTHPAGVIKDNAIIRMVENSIYNGALYKYRYADTGEGDVTQMLTHLRLYWTTVRELFPEAWGLPPRRSRLSHGVGIAALGYVMDALTEDVPLREVGRALERLQLLAGSPWTSGTWQFGSEERRWNSLQNTPNDIRLLTQHLLSLVKAAT
jgi:DGQHR domain-containing protein